MRKPPVRFIVFALCLSPVLLVGFSASCVAWCADRVSAWCQKIWLEAYSNAECGARNAEQKPEEEK